MPVLNRKRRGVAPEEASPIATQRRRVGSGSGRSGRHNSAVAGPSRRGAAPIQQPIAFDDEEEAGDDDDDDDDIGSDAGDRNGNGGGSDEDRYSDGERRDGRSEGEVTRDRLVKKFVRLALASEYTRQPIRRTDVSAKVLGNQNSRAFKEVFEETQRQLREVFGMELVELPTREKLTISQKRAAQRSQNSQSQSSKSYMLTTTLPPQFRDPDILGAGSTQFNEETYVGIVTTLVSLIYLNGRSMPEAKLERYLRRLNLEDNTPIDKTEKLIQNMVKHGYLLRAREDAGGEMVTEYHLGPRAKVEIGKEGVLNMLNTVYGVQAPEGLEEKMNRSIGVEAKPIEREKATTQKKRGRQRRQEADEEEDSGDD